MSQEEIANELAKIKTYIDEIKTLLETLNQNLETLNQNLEAFNQNLETLNQNLEAFNQGLEVFSRDLEVFSRDLEVLVQKKKLINDLYDQIVSSNTEVTDQTQKLQQILHSANELSNELAAVSRALEAGLQRLEEFEEKIDYSHSHGL